MPVPTAGARAAESQGIKWRDADGLPPYQANQILMLPPSASEWLPKATWRASSTMSWTRWFACLPRRCEGDGRRNTLFDPAMLAKVCAARPRDLCRQHADAHFALGDGAPVTGNDSIAINDDSQPLYGQRAQRLDVDDGIDLRLIHGDAAWRLTCMVRALFADSSAAGRHRHTARQTAQG